MNKDYVIIDNFLPDFKCEKISKILLSNKFPWSYQDGIVTNEEDSKQIFYFSHDFCINGNIVSQYFYLLDPLIEALKPKRILRSKANLYTNCDKIIEHSMHYDFDFKHNGALYYINTNDGYTKICDNVKIKSIKNRMLMFDPSEDHCSTNCSDEKCRVNIIINYH